MSKLLTKKDVWTMWFLTQKARYESKIAKYEYKIAKADAKLAKRLESLKEKG